MDGLASVIKILDGYDDSNVSVNDNRILNTGQSKAVILWRMPGSKHFDITLGNPKTVQNLWQVGADVYCLSAGDPQTVMATLEEEVCKILDAISAYPNLDGTAGVVYAVADVPEDIISAQVAASNYYRQLVHVEVRELEQILVMEGAGA